MQLNNIFQSFGLAKNVTELIVLVLIILVISGLFWFFIGRFYIYDFLINIYISFALMQVIPKDIIPFTKYPSLLLFLIFLILFTLINKYLLDVNQHGNRLVMWKAFVMSFLEIMLLISIIFSFLPAGEISQYVSENYLMYFIDSWWRVLWMIMPLLFLIIIKKRK